MCKRSLSDKEILKLLENEYPSDSDYDLESSYEQGIYNIVGV